MKLYYSPGACSLAPHIALEEAGLPYEAIEVDLKSHTVKKTNEDFYKINPKGYVPALKLDDGALITEVAVTLQYIGDLKAEAKLLPAPGSLYRFRCQEWLNFIATELHKAFAPAFKVSQMHSKGECQEEMKSYMEKNLRSRFDYF